MPHSTKTESATASIVHVPEKRREFSSVMKWVGYLTAILSLCATIGGVAKYAYDRAQTNKNEATLIATAKEQQKAHDYRSAWQTLEKAQQVDPDSPRVRAAQTKLAMVWLDDVDVQGNETFSEVTQKLEPVLTRAAVSARSKEEQADLRAHIGWAYFLETRDGRDDVDPARLYREAANEDPNNPYAQAMWGHWILSQDCSRTQEAMSHFDAALASRREPDYVRSMQLAALLNCHDLRSYIEVIRVANAMRKEQRQLVDWERRDVFPIYFEEFVPQTHATAEIINAVPPAEHIATFRWLFDGLQQDDMNRWFETYCLGTLEEAAGQREAALADYRSAVAHLSAHSTTWAAANASAKRLSSPH